MNMRERIWRTIQQTALEQGISPIPNNEAAAIADAVLDALSQPTDAMVGAFHRMCDDNGACLVKPGFRAMIAAAKEPTP